MKIAIISGTGFKNILENSESVRIETPFGEHSDIYTGTLSGKEIIFLNRHGDGHRLAPHEIPYEANIFALKKLGVGRIISTSSTGIINNEILRGDIAVPDDLYDDTGRVYTLFKQPVVVHVSMDEPFCPELRKILIKSAENAREKCTYACTKGPQLETRAQIRAYGKLGFDIVGMTVAAEAKLAKEAEICYATISTCDNYATGVSGENPSAKIIISGANKNSGRVEEIIRAAVENIPEKRGCRCGEALKDAMI